MISSFTSVYNSLEIGVFFNQNRAASAYKRGHYSGEMATNVPAFGSACNTTILDERQREVLSSVLQYFKRDKNQFFGLGHLFGNCL